MAHFNSISNQAEFGLPPPHYKHVASGKVKPPDLDKLTSGSRDYVLAFNGNGNFSIPLKWKNPFLPADQANLGEKYTQEVLSQYEIIVDHAFLSSLKSDIDMFDSSTSSLQR